jgi:hypothetical protein
MRWFRFIGAIVAVGLLFGLGGAIFQTGYLAGATAGGTPVAVPVVGYGWGFGPFGLFGGFFHILGSIFVFFLVLGLLRAIFFGGRHRSHGGWGHGPRGSWGGPGGGSGGGSGDPERSGPWMDRAREVHDEWHRHQADASPDAAKAGASDAAKAGASDTPAGGA